ncbi:MAG: hypothetical protein HYR91_00340 [Flavobacteriia bacterium]|nr:hypothetical protein [Flavobacteriia bacterium]
MKLNLLICFLLSFILQSCFVLNHKFKITNDYIKSNRKFYQGFQFSELKIDSLDSIGVPITYKRVNTAYLYLNDYKKGKESKKIYFYKQNSNYLWHYYEDWTLPILPIEMKINSWYLIDGLVFWGNPTLSKFIYIDETGNCHSYTVPHISNW